MAQQMFAPPTWPDAAELVSPLVPTRAKGNASVGVALRVGIHDDREIVTVRVGVMEAGVDAAGLKQLIATLQVARAHMTLPDDEENDA